MYYPGADVISGYAEFLEFSFNVEEAGIRNANINTKAGNDIVDGTSVVTLVPNAQAIAGAFGIANTSVDLGTGNDALTAVGTSLAGLSGISNSYGMIGSQVLGANGNDTIFAVARSQSRIEAVAIAVGKSFINGGNNDDNIVIESKLTAEIEELLSGLSVGVENSTVSGGADNDTLRVSATGAVALNGSDAAISDTEVVYGLRTDTGLLGQSGNDFIKVEATGKAKLEATVIGSEDSKIIGGSGDDTIEVIAHASAESGGEATVVGVSQSRVKGDGGNDSITIAATVESSNGGGYGVQSSILSGGKGDDIIRVSINEGGTLDIDDSLVNGGSGNDTIDVGIGGVTIKGGSGSDTVVLDYLQQYAAGSFAVEALGGGLKISGSVTKSGGTGDSWQQQITSVENFTVAGTSYTAGEIIANFGAA